MSSPTTTTEVVYRDRQYSRMLLGLGLFIALGCGVAVGAVFGDVARAVVWLVVGGAVIASTWQNRLDVVVDADGVRLGRALLPWSAAGRVEVLTGPEFRAALTTDGHPNDYRQIRSTTAGLRVWVDDPSDPHRAWVASVRNPAALSDVLRTRGGR